MTKAKFGTPKLTIEVSPATGTTIQVENEQTELPGQDVGKPVESAGLEKVDPEPTSEEARVESLVQQAQAAVDSAAIDKQRDPGSAFEKGVSDLKETLGSIVDLLVDKVDALAEVCLNVDMSPLCRSYSLTTSMISSIPTPILPGRHALHCIG